MSEILDSFAFSCMTDEQRNKAWNELEARVKKLEDDQEDNRGNRIGQSIDTLIRATLTGQVPIE